MMDKISAVIVIDVFNVSVATVGAAAVASDGVTYVTEGNDAIVTDHDADVGYAVADVAAVAAGAAIIDGR